MLKDIKLEDIKLDEVNELSRYHIEFYKHRISEGSKICAKLNEQKNAKFINIYQYDKTRWKYLLIDRIRI